MAVRAGLCIALALAVAACGGGGGGGGGSMPAAPATFSYATWTASPQDLVEPFPGANRAPGETFADSTVRHVAHLSLGGTRLKVKLSNLFGAGPVTFASVRVARSAGGSAIDPSSDRAVTFGGMATLTAPAGTEFWSDEVDLPVARGADVAVSFYIGAPAQAVSGHIFANAPAYVVRGNLASAPTLAGGNQDARAGTYWLSAIAATGDRKPGVVVAFGDSITEGSQSTFGANLRYPDRLSERLAAESNPPISVVNAGIGGNRWVHDFPGPSGSARFERDVLGVEGVTHAILLLGINDIGVPHVIPDQKVTLEELIAATQAAVAKAHMRGVKVLPGTLLPFKGAERFDAGDELMRQGYNAWVRTQAVADGFVDFDAALRDPADPLALAPRFSSPDRLHPNDAGYGAMAAAVDLAKLR
jgi:lysophospholipase L1-like esterase